MNKNLKTALQSAFEAPPAAKKARFLKTLRYPKITYRDFLVSQLSYIRKRVWLLSATVLFLGWATFFFSPAIHSWHMEAGEVWTIAAILPFLALLTVMEIYRSAFFRMSELETSCRFSLPQIVMARVSILGGGNFIVLMLLLILINRVSPYGLLRLISYLVVPYLVTCGFCLMILNRMHSRESVYGCAAAACFVCLANTILSSTVQLLYSNAYMRYWLLLSAAAIILIGIQIHILRKKTEDKTWNLLLTE